MKYPVLLAAFLLGACATAGAPPIETKAQTVVVTRTEKAITPDQVNAVTPPAPLGARPADAKAALEVAIAKMCEYVGFGRKLDVLAQTAAGLTPAARVVEPVCDKVVPAPAR